MMVSHQDFRADVKDAKMNNNGEKTMTQDNKPIKMPDAWPTDNRSRLALIEGAGWVLSHPDRLTMIYTSGKWRQMDERVKIKPSHRGM
jgi:hypothetical protein